MFKTGCFSVLFALSLVVCGCEKPQNNPGVKRIKSSPARSCWEVVGSPGFSKGSITNLSLQADGGVPYVSFLDGGLDDALVVMRFVQGAWEPVGINPVPEKVGKPCMIVSNGVPYIVFTAHSDGSRVAAVRFTGSAWEPFGSSGLERTHGDNPRISVADGKAFIAYVDRSKKGVVGITVMTLAGNRWISVGSPMFTTDVTDEISIRSFDSVPFVAYADSSAGERVTVRRFSGSTWEEAGQKGFSSGAATSVSLSSDGSSLFLAYQDAGIGNRATVMEYANPGWRLAGNVQFSASTASFVSLSVYAGSPWVAYSDFEYGYRATVTRLDSLRLAYVGSPGFSEKGVGYTKIAVENGVAYVAYSDGEKSGKITVMKCSGK